MILRPAEYKHYLTTNVLHISQSALDLRTVQQDDSVQVWIKTDKSKNLVATLNNAIPQVRLDLAFSKNEDLLFSTKGSGTVHLTGYYISIDDESESEQSNVRKKQSQIVPSDDDTYSQTTKNGTARAKNLLESSGNMSGIIIILTRFLPW